MKVSARPRCLAVHLAHLDLLSALLILSDQPLLREKLLSVPRSPCPGPRPPWGTDHLTTHLDPKSDPNSSREVKKERERVGKEREREIEHKREQP